MAVLEAKASFAAEASTSSAVLAQAKGVLATLVAADQGAAPADAPLPVELDTRHRGGRCQEGASQVPAVGDGGPVEVVSGCGRCSRVIGRFGLGTVRT
jgi:hypothetical protein